MLIDDVRMLLQRWGAYEEVCSNGLGKSQTARCCDIIRVGLFVMGTNPDEDPTPQEFRELEKAMNELDDAETYHIHQKYVHEANYNESIVLRAENILAALL